MDHTATRGRFRVRLYGSVSTFRFLDIKGAPEDQIRLAIASMFALARKSFRLIEVRVDEPPQAVTYGDETGVHGGLSGAHEIIVDGSTGAQSSSFLPASARSASQVDAGVGVVDLIIAAAVWLAWRVHQPPKARESRSKRDG